MRLSGKPDKEDNVCILYGDVADYALYNQAQNFTSNVKDGLRKMARLYHQDMI